MNMSKHLAAIIWVALAQMVLGQGCEVGYNPYINAIHPKSEKCAQAASEIHADRFYCKNGETSISIVDDSNTNRFIELKVLNEMIKFGPYNHLIGNSEVYSTELNGDSKPDYISVQYFAGNGCGAGICKLFFLRSFKDGFTSDSIITMGFGPEHIVSISGKTRIVQTKMAQAKGHTFYVFRLLDLNKTEIVEDKKASQKWVQYTDKPQFNETKKLTSKEKAALSAAIDWINP